MENSCHLSHDKLLSLTHVRIVNYRRSRPNLLVSLDRLWPVLFSKQGCSCNFGNVFSIHVNNAFYEEINTIIKHSERHTPWKTLWGNWQYSREKTQQYTSNIFFTEWFKESGNKTKTRIFWDIILCRLVKSYRCFRVASHLRVHRPWRWRQQALWNISNYLSTDMASHPRRCQSSSALLWECQTLHYNIGFLKETTNA